jgi:prepilin-type processing-associated H-X9-DG protein
MANLRDIGAQINGYAAENGFYPRTEINKTIWDLTAEWSGSGRHSIWCCPARLIKKGTGSTPNFTPSYSANDRVFPATGLRVAAVPRPSQVIALIDASQRSPSGWANHQMNVPGAENPDNAEKPFQHSPIAKPNTDINATACVRYRHNGAANALFLDGHVEAKKLGSILEKNISITY